MSVSHHSALFDGCVSTDSGRPSAAIRGHSVGARHALIRDPFSTSHILTRKHNALQLRAHAQPCLAPILRRGRLCAATSCNSRRYLSVRHCLRWRPRPTEHSLRAALSSIASIARWDCRGSSGERCLPEQRFRLPGLSTSPANCSGAPSTSRLIAGFGLG